MELLNHSPNKPETPRFTHFRVYSSYSLGVGLNSPADLCAQAARLGYSSLAITDTGATYGFIELHLAARKYGLKPIYGILARHLPALRRREDPPAVTLIAASADGLRRIAEIASLIAAQEDGAPIGLDVLRAHGDGLIAITGTSGSEIGKLLQEGDDSGAETVVNAFREIFHDRFFIEVQDHGRREERRLAEKLIALSSRTGAAPILTHEVKYVAKGMRSLYETLRGIRHPGEDRDFFPIDSEAADWSLKSPTEMSQLRAFYEAAFDNTARIDDMIPGDLLDRLDEDPDRGVPRGSVGCVSEELTARSASALASYRGGSSDPEFERRRSILEGELQQIVSNGYGPAFLLFHRIASRLGAAGIEKGPATGLGFQSLCAHLLGITSFDPYHYEETFHPRFDLRARDAREFELQLTPETRSAAVHEISSMFGYGEVGYLPAIERITPAKAVRMAASVVNTPESELEEVEEIITRRPGTSIERLYDVDKRLGSLYRRSLSVRDLLTRAALLEDLPIGIVRSRRSLALSPVSLTSFLGYSIDSETGDLFLQAGREHFPAGGVFRVDVTSLGGLSVALRADRDLREERIADYGWDGFSLEDADVWQQIQRGDTTGIFLFEGQATRQQRESFRIESIEDLTNFLSLMRLRDGEQSLSERFSIFQEQGAATAEENDVISRVLTSTGGNILYHEQIRDVILALTGCSAQDAWQMVQDLRSASPGTLAAVRSRFMSGAAENNVEMEIANRWFEKSIHHAKSTISHKRVFADALLVYKLFLLRTRHEPWFYAALLNSNVENEGKLEKYLAPLRSRGMLLGLDVNRSEMGFSVEARMVRTGFCTVPGLEAEVVERIRKVRAKRKFDSFEDFVRRVGMKHLKREDIRRLIEAGAFDAGGLARGELSKRLPVLFKSGKSRASGDNKGQLELPFDA
jgi:DNA polymerase-3 subunit alpha